MGRCRSAGAETGVESEELGLPSATLPDSRPLAAGGGRPRQRVLGYWGSGDWSPATHSKDTTGLLRWDSDDSPLPPGVRGPPSFPEQPDSPVR